MRVEGMTPVKRSIMIVLSLLVGLFIIGMWLMSSLNLDFAQKTMSELRQHQIADTFHANLDRINAHHRLMEQNTRELARVGQLFERQQSLTGRHNTQELEDALAQTLSDVEGVSGGGIWFQPDAYQKGPFAVYGFKVGSQLEIVSDDTDFAERDWYAQIQPPDDRLWALGTRFYWSPAYYHTSTEKVVVSLSTPIRDEQQQVIGLASTDWRADEIIRMVSRVEVTPGTFSFLIDSDNRNLSSLSRADDVRRAQQLMDAISRSELHKQTIRIQPPDILASPLIASPMQRMSLTVNDEQYKLFFSETVAGMVFGIGVPKAEIDAAMTPMRDRNMRIAAIIGIIFLVLAGLVLYIIAGTLRQLSNLYTDSLTRMPNREKLLEDLRKTDSAALLLLNLDAFKQVNDFYGHECGDHVIIKLSEALQRFMASRAAWRHCSLYSMPGDEMAIVIPGHHAPASLPPRLEEVAKFITLMDITWQGHDIPLHATIGAASTVQPDNSRLNGEQLLPSASMALKLARLNRLSYFVYDPANRVREGYEQNLIWANRLKNALDEGRIVPFFQPILNVRTGRIDKFECLARMIDLNGDPLSPEQFLPIAKQIRLYRFITRAMVEQCFQRFANSRYDFSVNLCCEDLLDTELTTFILQQLDGNELANRVIFEILESQGIENYSQVREFIDKVKTMGARIAIDDFGTGYSNFEHLLRLNIDLIKIDGSLVSRLGDSEDALTLTRGIVQSAKEMGVHTVAEYVHNPEILEQVRALGIDYAQGAYIGMPAGALITEVQLV